MLWLIAELHSLSPVLVIRDGGQRRVEAVDVERHVTLITQQLHVSILLPTTHTAGAEATLGVRVSLAVLTLRPAFPWIQEQEGITHRHMHTYDQKPEDDLMVWPRQNIPSKAIWASVATIFTVYV